MFSTFTTPLPDTVRTARPDDYDRIAPVVDAWWGRPILGAVPRLFLDHFHTTSLIAESAAATPAGPGSVAPEGFLIGFGSPSRPEEAYIHFVGISPGRRRQGLAAQLYEIFLDGARTAGCRRVGAVTSPVNTGSIAFHRAMGFTVDGVRPEHNGPGHPLVTFSRNL